MNFINQNSDGTVTLTAPVMIPGAKDCDYEHGETPLTKDQIREFAKSYENYQFIDHEHGLTRNGVRIGTPVKSFLLSETTTMTTIDGSLKSYPEGSWFITAHLTNEDAINTALEGGYTGYSASVFSKNRADEYYEALKVDKDTPLPTACKSISSGGTALIKDVPNPVVLSVSLVKKPCLHDSKICKLETDDGEIMENQEDVKSLKSKVLSAMGMSEEAEVEALKSEVVTLKGLIEDMRTEFDAALKSMQEEFKQTLTEAMKPVDEVAEKSETEEVEEEAEPETTEEVEVEEEVEEEATEEVAEKSEVVEHGESKAEPIHDNLEAQKSKPFDFYAYMGRTTRGTRKK